MTDRELLEKAAKAAGVNLRPSAYTDSAGVTYDNGWNWNPITDDGDALRLAVKLHLSLDLFDDEILVGYTPNCNTCDQVQEIPGQDPYAATRRAIVRAAEKMKEKEEC